MSFEKIFIKKKISGYAETNSIESFVAEPKNIVDCKKIINIAIQDNLNLCCKGSGLSYGDMITNQDNIIIDLSRMNNITSWDSKNGVIVLEPGVTFSQVLLISLKNNWTLSSCPGSMDITIGGAISNNVHGKDSFSFGNFGKQVLEMKILLASGEIKTVNNEISNDLFNAVIGGMGLLGIIVEIKLQLNQVKSPYLKSKEFIAENIFQAINILNNNVENYDFGVAWIDCFSDKKNNIGRGYVSLAEWGTNNISIEEKKLIKSLKKSDKLFGIFPVNIIWPILKLFFNRKNIKIFNSFLYYYKFIKLKFFSNRINNILFSNYNFIHNKIPDIKNIHKPNGFLEFQPLIPQKYINNFVSDLFALCNKHQTQSILCGLKLHSKDEYLLSYSANGFSMGIDIELKNRKKNDISLFANAFFSLVLKNKGILYLAKDELLDKNNFQLMYPKYKSFLLIKKHFDPKNLFSSDLYRRLFL